MLSISTSWMPQPELGLRQWLIMVQSLGFDAIELSYKVTATQLKAFEALLPEFSLKISSIHNFCPTPDDGPSPRHVSNYYRLSSTDETERALAVKWTCIAMDTAKRHGAKVVVIHAGTLDFEDERSPRLFELYTSGQQDTEAFVQERARILRLREEKRGPYIEALDKSLETLATYARQQQVLIGLETRYYPIEIPNFEEIAYFLNKFGPEVMGYWHDVGHAEINGRLGIHAHQEFLTAYQGRLIGAHIHGMKGRRDHLAPFEGDMDLEAILPFFGPNVIRVVESKPFADEGKLKQAVARLKL